MDKYPKILRIFVSGMKIRGKHYLNQDQVEELLEGLVIIEEKIDGTKTVMEDTPEYTIFGEDVRFTHTVHYKLLPGYFIAFDVFDKRQERLLDRREKEKFLKVRNIPCVPLLYGGKVESVDFLLSFLGKKSAFGAARIEGIVIKNYRKNLFGKIVDPLFEHEVDSTSHWRKKPRKMNFLART